MPSNRGVFPGQWGLPGGGVEDGETIEQALHREIVEETGLTLTKPHSLFFTDGGKEKRLADGSRRSICRVFLICEAVVASEHFSLNQEFDGARRVDPEHLCGIDLNAASRNTFPRVGLLTDT